MLFRRNFHFEGHKLPVHSNQQKKTYCVPVTEELRSMDSKLAVLQSGIDSLYNQEHRLLLQRNRSYAFC
jgi:hypothetical protein